MIGIKKRKLEDSTFGVDDSQPAMKRIELENSLRPYALNLMDLLHSSTHNRSPISAMKMEKSIYSRLSVNTFGVLSKVTSSCLDTEHMKEIIEIDEDRVALVYKYSIIVYDVKNNIEITEILFSDDGIQISSVFIISRNKIGAVVSKTNGDSRIAVYDITTSHPQELCIKNIKNFSNVESIDDNTLLYSSFYNRIMSYNIATNQTTVLARVNGQYIMYIKYLKESNRMITVSIPGYVELWDCNSYTVIKSIRFNSVCVSIVTVPLTETIYIYDTVNKITVLDNSFNVLSTHDTTRLLLLGISSYCDSLGLIVAKDYAMKYHLLHPETLESKYHIENVALKYGYICKECNSNYCDVEDECDSNCNEQQEEEEGQQYNECRCVKSINMQGVSLMTKSGVFINAFENKLGFWEFCNNK